jgi:MYND finger
VSVTPPTHGPSRNTDEWCPLCDCLAKHPEYNGSSWTWQQLAPDGYRHRYSDFVGLWWEHCTSCHSPTHNACAGCGACLGKRLTGYSNDDFHDYVNYRVDRTYCSNACKQRAYRKRKAT